MIPAPSQTDIQTALRGFILSVYPAIECFEGQDNRVSEPQATDFIVMTTIGRRRISQNVDIYADVAFTGAISGNGLATSNLLFGTIQIGATLFGAGVNANTTILAQTAGTPGGAGEYTLSTYQSLSYVLMAAGNVYIYQPTEVNIQLDFHSANVSDSADMAQAISTLFRDEVCIDAFIASGVDASPLYADDPQQVPFLNSEQQYETRYVLNAFIQANQEVPWPQQFMGSISVKSIFPVL